MTHLILSPDALLWPTLWLSVASLLALVALRGVRSPTVHRVTCVVILLQGWIWWRCDCPVLPATESASTIEISNAEGAGNVVLDRTQARHEVHQEDNIHAVATPSVEPANVDLEMMEAAILAVDNSPPVTDISPAPATIAYVTPAADQPSATVPIDWSRWLFAVWIGGILATVAVWTARYVVFQRHLPDIDELPTEYQAQWREVCERTGLSSSIPLWGLANLGPACGLMKRRFVVFVPTDRWQTFSAEQRWAILLHEAAHLSRGDLWRSLCVRLLALPQWFNPLAWRMVRRFDEAAEWACDEFVLNDQQASAPEFAEALLSLSVGPSGHPQFSAAANGHPLSERVRRLLSPQPSEKTMTKRTLLVAALALCTVANFVRLSAQEESEADVAESTPASGEEAPAAVATDGAPGDDETSIVETADEGTVLFGGVLDSAGHDLESEFSTFSFDVGFDDGRTPSEATEPASIDGFDLQGVSPVEGSYAEDPATENDITIPTFDDSAPRVSGPGPGILDENQPVPDTSDSPYFTGSQPGDSYGQPNPYAPTRNEAVIDMSEVFKRSTYFLEQKEELAEHVRQMESQQAELVAEMRRRQEEIQNSEASPEMQNQLTRLQVEFESRVAPIRVELLQEETEIYYDTYRRIRAVIAAYARENQIHTVRRVRNPVSDDNASTDQILELINRDIVYSADEPRDITEDIVERLNAIDAQANHPRQMMPYSSDSIFTPPPPGGYSSPYGQPVPSYPVPTTRGGDSTLPPSIPGAGSGAIPDGTQFVPSVDS